VIKGKLGFQVAYGHDKLERNFRDFQKRPAAMRFTRSTSTAFKCLPFCPPISRPSFYFVVLMYVPCTCDAIQLAAVHASQVHKTDMRAKCSARVRRANHVSAIPQTNEDWMLDHCPANKIPHRASMTAMFVIIVFTV
jgi:hypothetical protein